MYRNQNSLFATNPTNIDMARSTFDRNQSVKTSFSAGDVVPFYLDEVLPGDTHQVKTAKVIRMPSLITPVMDNIVLDTFFFFVPARLCWDHWKEFMGENTESAWIPQTEYAIPQITAPEGGWDVGTIADYLGLPTGVGDISVNALPFRAYALVMNEWFRDQNLTDPLNIDTGDSTVQGVNTGTYVTDVAKGGLPFKAAKFHDLFTSALPAPQKGPSVPLPVASGNVSVLPVSALENNWTVDQLFNDGTNAWPVRIGKTDLTGAGASTSRPAYLGVSAGSGSPGNMYSFQDATSQSSNAGSLAFANLGADASGLNINIGTINDLRMAFQIQKYYEKAARGGR